MNKETYSDRSHCCKYVKPNTKKRKVVFKEALLFDIAHSDTDLRHFSVYGNCASGKHQDISLNQWNSLTNESDNRAPERYKSSPEILSPTEKHRYFYDIVLKQDRQSEEARQFKQHLSIEESKQDEKSRSALELREVEHRQQGRRVRDGNEGRVKLKHGKDGKTGSTGKPTKEEYADSFSRFGRTRQQVSRQKGARRPRSSSVQGKKNERSRKRSYDIPLQNREGQHVDMYAVPDIDQRKVSLENFIERDIIFSVEALQDGHVSTSGNLSSFEQLESSIDAENNVSSSLPAGRKKVCEITSDFEKLSMDDEDPICSDDQLYVT